MQTLRFTAKSPGRVELKLGNARRWEKDVVPIACVKGLHRQSQMPRPGSKWNECTIGSRFSSQYGGSEWNAS